jgi:hypothetical protein
MLFTQKPCIALNTRLSAKLRIGLDSGGGANIFWRQTITNEILALLMGLERQI